jgi:hypothetical protein
MIEHFGKKVNTCQKKYEMNYASGGQGLFLKKREACP